MYETEKPRRGRRDVSVLREDFFVTTAHVARRHRAAIDMLQQRSPETKFDTHIGRYVDERLMDELEREGFFKKIGGKS